MMDRDKARSSQLIGQSTKCFQCGKMGILFNKFVLLNIRRFPELQLEKKGFACKLVVAKRLHTRRGKFQYQNERLLVSPKSPLEIETTTLESRRSTPTLHSGSLGLGHQVRQHVKGYW